MQASDVEVIYVNSPFYQEWHNAGRPGPGINGITEYVLVSGYGEILRRVPSNPDAQRIDWGVTIFAVGDSFEKKFYLFAHSVSNNEPSTPRYSRKHGGMYTSLSFHDETPSEEDINKTILLAQRYITYNIHSRQVSVTEHLNKNGEQAGYLITLSPELSKWLGFPFFVEFIQLPDGKYQITPYDYRRGGDGIAWDTFIVSQQFLLKPGTYRGYERTITQKWADSFRSYEDEYPAIIFDIAHPVE